MNESFREMLKRHEGFRQYPYKCTAGKLTIGYGRNLEDVGITVIEAEYLLDRDIHKASVAFDHNFKSLSNLDIVRKNVLINMIFNMGANRLKGFKKMIAALEKQDYQKAADEMLNSKWALQVGKRAIELAEIMRNGE